MNMRIIETRQHQLSTRIDNSGRGPTPALDVSLGSNRHNPLPYNRNRLRPW